MKIAVITLHSVKNYGSILQTIATQDLFQRKGCDVEIINYTREDIRFLNNIRLGAKNRSVLKRSLYFIVLFPTQLRYYFLWKNIYSKHIKLGKRYDSYSDLCNNPPLADIYCSGSDQVWNSKWNGGVLKEYFLGFASDSDILVSFSSSVGMNKIPENEQTLFYEMLSKFSLISVREKHSAMLLNQIGIKNVTCILDPTLIEPADYWINFISNKRIFRKKYLLIYQLNANENFDNYAKTLSKNLNLEIVRIAIRFDNIVRNGHKKYIPNLQKFLNLFLFADFVLTDSFHGLSFSLNFNKQFAIILPSKFNQRLMNILELTSTNDRIVKDYNNYDIANNMIDYNYVNEVIEKERKKSLNYIDNILKFKES